MSTILAVKTLQVGILRKRSQLLRGAVLLPQNRSLESLLCRDGAALMLKFSYIQLSHEMMSRAAASTYTVAMRRSINPSRAERKRQVYIISMQTMPRASSQR